MTPPLPAPADPTEADRKLAAEIASPLTIHIMDEACDFDLLVKGCQCIDDDHTPCPQCVIKVKIDTLLTERVASLLSSERAKVRREVREEDCRAVCEWCAPRKSSDLEEKAKPAAWRDGKWWHLVELPDGTAHPYQFWRECTAAPIRSLSLPEPPATEPDVCTDPDCPAESKCGKPKFRAAEAPARCSWCGMVGVQHLDPCEPPKPEPTR